MKVFNKKYRMFEYYLFSFFLFFFSVFNAGLLVARKEVELGVGAAYSMMKVGGQLSGLHWFFFCRWRCAGYFLYVVLSFWARLYWLFLCFGEWIVLEGIHIESPWREVQDF